MAHEPFGFNIFQGGYFGYLCPGLSDIESSTAHTCVDFNVNCYFELASASLSREISGSIKIKNRWRKIVIKASINIVSVKKNKYGGGYS
ncbi:hypothetical protein BMS3Abin06_02202 [bacterium BMS3Abin06]|nr:hypothetical protein BMS3Abin06_02202 [bacterium BMS3Abin06]